MYGGYYHLTKRYNLLMFWVKLGGWGDQEVTNPGKKGLCFSKYVN